MRDLRRPFLAYGLRDGRSDPAGLLLGSINGARAQVLSLFVQRTLRQAGRGLALLSAFERTVMREEVTELWAEYAATLPQRSAFELCLATAGWDQPRVRESRLSGRIGDWLTAQRQWPGLDRIRDDRAGIAFAPWRPEFADAAAVRLLEQQSGFHPGLSPSRHLGVLDLSISLVILRQGLIVGWVLAEQPHRRPDGVRSIRWPAAYVSEDLWKSGILIRACWHSLALAAERHGADVTSVFYAALPGIRAMAMRRLAGVSSVADIIEVRKKLPPEAREIRADHVFQG